MMRCQWCDKPMKQRLVTDEFAGADSHVTVTGIPAGVCSYCGQKAMDPNALDEIEMFLRPLLGGGLGMHMLRTPHVTIDLGHSLHPSAIDIARPVDRPAAPGFRAPSHLEAAAEEPTAAEEVRAA